MTPLNLPRLKSQPPSPRINNSYSLKLGPGRAAPVLVYGTPCYKWQSLVLLNYMTSPTNLPTALRPSITILFGLLVIASTYSYKYLKNSWRLSTSLQLFFNYFWVNCSSATILLGPSVIASTYSQKYLKKSWVDCSVTVESCENSWGTISMISLLDLRVEYSYSMLLHGVVTSRFNRLSQTGTHKLAWLVM